MSKITKIRKSKSIDHTKYVNSDTGELLTSEINNNVSISIKEGTDQFIINSDNYTTFTREAMEYIRKELSHSELGKILSISDMLKTEYSIITKENNHPHTPETLSIELDMNLNKWYEFVRKMVKKNILAYCVCAPSGYVQKIYMLNPFIARKRTVFNTELNLIFRDITKDGKLSEDVDDKQKLG